MLMTTTSRRLNDSGGQATERPCLRAVDGEDFPAAMQAEPSAGREARRLAPLGPQV